MNLKMLFEHIRVDTPLIAMIVVVIISAVGVIYSKHLSRNEFIQLQQLEKQRDLLNEESVSYTHLTLPTNREV